VLRLIEGASEKAPTAILQVDTDTYTTAVNAGQVRPALTPENDRKIASALGLFESHVDLGELESRIEVVRSTRKTPIMFEYELIERAREKRRHIVLPEGTDERILRATEILLYRGVADLTLLGKPKEIQSRIGALGLDLGGLRIIDPQESDRREGFAAVYYDLRKHKGVSREMAADTMADVNYFGTMMVHMRAMPTAWFPGPPTPRPRPFGRPCRSSAPNRGCRWSSSVLFMCLADRVLAYGDCAVNPDPDASQLADIAITSAQTAECTDIEPRVAMCSYSTGTSGKGKDVDKVRRPQNWPGKPA
jgi:phosphate acetyltransferase